MNENETPQRENVRAFKGVWIPVEVWLCPELSATDKALYAEISSLDGDEGCFASNDYLAEFLGLTIRSVQRSIVKLKEHGFICAESFNGRTRVLRISHASFHGRHDKNFTSEVTKISRLPRQKCHGRHDKNVMADTTKMSPIYNNRENSLEHSLENNKTPIIPQGGDSAPAKPSKYKRTDTSPKFSEAWQAYPHYRNGNTCRSSLKASWEVWQRNGLEEVADEIIAHCRAIAANPETQRTNRRFVKAFQSYLRLQAWESAKPIQQSHSPESRQIVAVSSQETQHPSRFADLTMQRILEANEETRLRDEAQNA